MSTLSTSRTVQNPGAGSNGVWFDVQSEGPPLRITAILAACGRFHGTYSSGAVVLYGSEEGSGVGKERERGAWGQLAAGTLQHRSKGATRLVLSSPLSVRAGARVGLYLHCTDHRSWVCLTAPGKQGDVDASDGALAVLYGRCTFSTEPFGEFDGSHCFVPAGAIEYELAIAEADPSEPAPEQSPLERVCALGFAPSEATAALAACGGDALRAVERLVRSRAEAEHARIISKH